MSLSENTRRWCGLVAIALGVALIVVDTTIVNVITPSVIDDLGIDSSQAQWIQESYAIVFAALLLVVGRLSDLRGARTVFVVGVVLFGATSLLAGLAPTGGLLIVARFLQGVGAACILPTSLALLNSLFSGPARGQAFAVWGSTIGAATALGPVIGGWLAEHASWRWAFGINIPLTLVILAITVVFLPQPRKVPGRVDLVGAALSIAGLGLLAFGLVEGRVYGWLGAVRPFTLLGVGWETGPSPVLISLIGAVVLLTLFVRRQIVASRPDTAGQPLMNTRLFGIASFRNGNIATVIIGLGEFGIIAVLPLWLQFTLGYSPLQAGLALVPIAVGSFVASGISFPLAARVRPITFVRVGLALEAVALAGLGGVAAWTDAAWWLVAAVLALYGVGVGFATSQVTNVVLAEVPADQAGQGSGIQSAFRQLGSALGIAALTSIYFSVLGTSLYDRLTTDQVPPAQAAALGDAVTSSAGAAIGPLSADPATASIADAAREAMSHAVGVGSAVAAGFLVVGVAATLLIRDPRPKRPDAPSPRENAVSG